jgi:hypothetical protein
LSGPHGLTSLSERGLELQAASARTVGKRISVPALCTKSVSARQMRKTDSTWDKTDTPRLSTKAAISAGYREELTLRLLRKIFTARAGTAGGALIG